MRSDRIKQDYAVKVQVVARARALAEAAKKRALEVETTAAAEEALYKARLYARAKAAAEAERRKSEEAWAQMLAFYAEMKAENTKAHAVLFQHWNEAESRVELAINKVSLIQTDLVE